MTGFFELAVPHVWNLLWAACVLAVFVNLRPSKLRRRLAPAARRFGLRLESASDATPIVEFLPRVIGPSLLGLVGGLAAGEVLSRLLWPWVY